MATFSVISHDDRPGNDASAGLATSPYRQGMSALIAPSARVDSPLRPHQGGQLPATVLKLPDLAAAQEETAQWHTSMGNRLFWVGILLGALLALFLIWNPGGRTVRQLDDAPSWSGHDEATSTVGDARHQHAHHDAPQHAHPEVSSESAPSWPPVSRGNARAPAHHAHNATGAPPHAAAEQADSQPAGAAPLSHGELDASPAGGESGPAFHEGMGRASAPPATRTARSGEAVWDGTAPAVEHHHRQNVAPGEAAPTGIIKSMVHE